ncbi:hypothetical protein ACFPOA_14405 [Lysobacter niabensis]|uniref:hypothetical protein n=1 Tax=Agrilutibacter niabensis TaxID=380628 RepID=UPI00361423F8
MKISSVAEVMLKKWGASPQAISTSDKEESDWIAEIDGFRVLVEEKTKLDNPEFVAARETTLAKGEVFGAVTSLAPNNRLSAIVRKGASQLDSSSVSTAHDARILWLTAIGREAGARWEQAFSTLYGSTKVYEIGKGEMRNCYFFHHSAFFRFRAHLDGAVIGCLRGSELTLRFCLNPYSERWLKLRASPFGALFPTGLIDPVEEEARGRAYLADTDIDRRDSGAVLDFVSKKYGLKLAQFMDLTMVSGTVALDMR